MRHTVYRSNLLWINNMLEDPRYDWGEEGATNQQLDEARIAFIYTCLNPELQARMMAKGIRRDTKDKPALLSAIAKECLETQKWTSVLAAAKEETIWSLPIRHMRVAEVVDEWERKADETIRDTLIKLILALSFNNGNKEIVDPMKHATQAKQHHWRRWSLY